MRFADATWADIEQLRERIALGPGGVGSATNIAEVAQGFANVFADVFPSVVLVRVFLVQPMSELPPSEAAYARAFVNADARLRDNTPVLCLLGTRGREATWNERLQSRGHLAIPLLDRTFVQGAPMIAKLLADLEVDLQGLDDGRGLTTRRMLGGRNGTFYVADAQTSLDAQGRPVIPAQDFVKQHEVRSVFGMGGAYVDGTLAIAVIFTTETLDRLVSDRFPSFISTFKMASASLLAGRRVFA